ncbi:hypothetical protein D3C86_1502290 [compost metagenome]
MHQSPDRTRRARRLREELTPAETHLWSLLRNRGFEGWKFRRQAPVAGYVTDFLCPELRLVIELDGGVHRLREAEDALRDHRLAEAGFAIVRFSNEAFLHNPNILLDAIRLRAAQMGKSPPHPACSASHLLPRGEKEDISGVEA